MIHDTYDPYILFTPVSLKGRGKTDRHQFWISITRFIEEVKFLEQKI